jgi:hypothetical protein
MNSERRQKAGSTIHPIAQAFSSHAGQLRWKALRREESKGNKSR